MIRDYTKSPNENVIAREPPVTGGQSLWRRHAGGDRSNLSVIDMEIASSSFVVLAMTDKKENYD